MATNSQNVNVFKDENSANSKNPKENKGDNYNNYGQTTSNQEKISGEDSKQTEMKKVRQLPNINKQDDFTYPMRRGGPALLFNHEKFKNDERDSQKRKGTKYDAQDLINIFKDRNINLELCQDWTYKEIMEKIKKVAEEDHSERDCLVVVVLTHGVLTSNGEELILAHDNVGYPPSQLWLPFSDERCPSLAGKPKVFIIQACRGSDSNQGIERGLSPPGAESNAMNEPPNDSRLSYKQAPIDPDSKCRVFNMPDLLVARSTFIGYKSYRFEDTGAIYIDHLAQIMKDGNLTHLVSLLTKVNCNVSRMEMKEDKRTVLQIPCFTSTLTKKLYF